MSSPSSRPSPPGALEEALDRCIRDGVSVGRAKDTFLHLLELAGRDPASMARARAAVVLTAAAEAMDERATPGMVTLVLTGVKRILGKSMDDPAFRLFAAQNSVHVKKGPRDVPVLTVGARDLTAVQIVAEILRHLRSRTGNVVTRDEFLLDVWGYPTANVETRTVDNTLAALRKKIERDPANPVIVLTVRGRGYRYGG